MSSAQQRRRKEEQAYLEWVGECVERALVGAGEVVSAAGDVGTFRALSSAQDRVRHGLEHIDEPLFGRLDFVEYDEDFPATIYVGLKRIRGETASDDAVWDWRSPLGERYMQATRDEPMNVGRRSTIKNAAWVVSKVSDDMLTPGFVAPSAETVEVPLPPGLSLPPGVSPEEWVVDLTGAEPSVAAQDSDVTSASFEVAELPFEEPTQTAEGDEAPGSIVELALADDPPEDFLTDELAELGVAIRGEDALYDELVRDRTGHMTEVVATIQRDQDRILRADPFRALAIQGGPGTGKTVVALHRAAWVIYHLQEMSKAVEAPRVLVVGPNDRFIEYISEVLPSLGETTVEHYSLHRLALSNLNVADRPALPLQRKDSPAAARVKGDARMVDLLRVAVWLGCEPAAVTAPYGRFVLRADVDSVKRLIDTAFADQMPYRTARVAIRSGIVALLIADLHHREGALSLSARAREDLERELARHLAESEQLDAMFPEPAPRDIVRRLYFDPEFRARCNDFLSGEELAALQPERGTPRSYKWTSADLALLDEAAALIRGSDDRYAHVVVDEAQDLSPMQWRMVRRRSRGTSLTITGDIAQATKQWCPSTWQEVATWLELDEQFDVVPLTLGYRVPMEIMAYAARLLKIAAPTMSVPMGVRSGDEPREIPLAAERATEAMVEVVSDWAGEPGGLTAVVAAPTRVEAAAGRLEELGLGSERVTVVPSTEAKGMEFDRVIVVNPDEIVGDDGALGMRRLYIALTRSTRQLAVVGAMSVIERLEGSGSLSGRGGSGAVGSGDRARSTSSRRRDVFDPELLSLIRAAVAVPGVVYTVAQKAPNRISAIDETGIKIETGASTKKGSGPQLVPAWMFNEAWRQMGERESLLQQDLLKGTYGRAVKRSAAVMAVLALVEGVEVVAAKPTELRRC